MRGILLFLALSLSFSTLYAQDPVINFFSRYSTGIFDEGAAEIAAYDPGLNLIFFTNGDQDRIDALDMSNPGTPVLAFSIDISPYGDGINSVDVANGIVAAALEGDDFDQPGVVAFFDGTDGSFLATAPAGVLPDMLTFTADGMKVLVANEGEPNDSATADPEGSITIVDISGGADSPVATQISLANWNDRKQSLRNRGVRLNLTLNDPATGMVNREASVAQDLEPEYITIFPGDSVAAAICQENNALLVIDINNAAVLDIIALGEKDYNAGAPALQEFLLNELEGWPTLGTPVTQPDDPVFLGGFSGLWFEASESTEDSLVFYAIPDRGPNDGAVNRNNAFSWPDSATNATTNLRPFKLPDYQARIVKFSVNTANGGATLIDSIKLVRTINDTSGFIPITGRGNIPGFDETPVAIADGVVYTDTNWVADVNGVATYFTELEFDPFGGDFEGILIDKNGNFWMCDEYRPAIYKFAPNGILIDRYVPLGSSELGDSSVAFNFYGIETLPRNYSFRRPNRGFEAIAYDEELNAIYAFIQSPLDNPDSGIRNSDVIRILSIDGDAGTILEEFLYLLEKNKDGVNGRSRVDKMGDAVYVGNNRFWVLERDSGAPTAEDSTSFKKYIYQIDLTGATNIFASELARRQTGATLESFAADVLVDSFDITPVHKTKVLNLPSIGYIPSDKPEGIAGPLPGGRIAVLNDNDFGLAGAGVSDKSSLGIISFDTTYAIDPSDRDGGINIQNVPMRSFYMPDAITSIVAADGLPYILTANEGDAREYIFEDEDLDIEFEGFIDEGRGDDLMLNPMVFDTNTINAFMDDALFGRIKVTLTEGDLDDNGDNEIIYGYGARSFSIWDAQGNLVWDSGNDFEGITAEQLPEDFNSTDNENGSFDNRSDDKGPEPEAIEVGVVNGTPYAFIALERVGGIMAYDITDIRNPVFVEYVNTRNFMVAADSSAAGDLAPEDLTFVAAEDSPIDGVPMLISANEVSGTIAIFTLGEMVTSAEEVALEDLSLKVFPNPVAKQLYTNRLSDYAVYNTVGKLMGSFNNTQILNVSNLPAGTYVISDLKANENRLFIKH